MQGGALIREPYVPAPSAAEQIAALKQKLAETDYIAAKSVDLLIGILKARRSAQYAVNALNALMRIGEETEDLRQKIGFALSEFAGIPQNPLTICCFGSSRPLNILNRMRILICARLDKWGIHHYVETVLNGGKLTQVERNMWRRLCR